MRRSENVFTERERQVVKLLLDGFTSEQIAMQLSISAHTVKNHRKKLLDKVSAKNTAELVKMVRERGML